MVHAGKNAHPKCGGWRERKCSVAENWLCPTMSSHEKYRGRHFSQRPPPPIPKYYVTLSDPGPYLIFNACVCVWQKYIPDNGKASARLRPLP